MRRLILNKLQYSFQAGRRYRVTDELEAIRQLKARSCRFLDTKDVEACRGVFTTDVVVTLDMAVSTGGADPMTAPALEGAPTLFRW